MKYTLLRTLNTAVFLVLVFSFMPAVAQNILFEEGFESGTLDPDRWTANPAEDGGLVEPVRQITDVSEIPRTGGYALAMGRSEDGDATTNMLDLHLDLAGQDDVTLEFWLRSQSDDTHDEDAIYLSVDGGDIFYQVLDLRPANWGEGAYGLVVVDLSAAAAFEGLVLSEQTVVRFQQKGYRDFVGNSFTADGFFIDDVVVRGAPEYASLPFEEGFEADTLGPAWRVADPFNSDLTAAEVEAQWGFIMPVRRIADVADIPRTGEYALAMGRSLDASQNGVNAVDLHLNLEGEEEVTLEFWLRSQSDDTHDEDAIYLSVDGGDNFFEVLDLRPANWGEGAYGLVVVDLSAAAAFEGLELSDQTVVRFQQKGYRDFVGTSFTADGFFIDDVVVRGAPEYASLPFEEGFEADTLGPAWRVADPFNSDLTALEAEAQWGFILPVRRISDLQGVPHTGEYALAMGRSLDAPENGVNAVDLHLKLKGQEDVSLEFWLRSQFDDTHDEDAIYLSVDGGENFTKAYAIAPEELEQTVYTNIVLDLDSIAREINLELSDQTVVRFQQKGYRDFVGTSFTADGFFIDDLAVTASESGVSLIEDQTFSISENAAAGTNVASLPTTDAEGNALSYQLLSQSLEGTFTVSNSGEIQLADEAQLDFATNPVLTLEVEASNELSSSSATITINVTEHTEGSENTAPGMEEQSFTIAENSEAGMLVGTITASDAEGDAISYSITEGNTDEAFAMNEETGELIVQNTAALDFETSPLFTLTVEATDGTLASDATITIELTDIENEAPTSVADELRNAFLLYPNPVNDYLQLEIPGQMQGSTLTIYTLKGEKLQEQSLEKKEMRLNMSRVPAGNYLIRIQKGDQEFNFKVMKK